jgi:hypothetical protein
MVRSCYKWFLWTNLETDSMLNQIWLWNVVSPLTFLQSGTYKSCNLQILTVSVYINRITWRK